MRPVRCRRQAGRTGGNGNRNIPPAARLVRAGHERPRRSGRGNARRVGGEGACGSPTGAGDRHLGARRRHVAGRRGGPSRAAGLAVARRASRLRRAALARGRDGRPPVRTDLDGPLRFFAASAASLAARKRARHPGAHPRGVARGRLDFLPAYGHLVVGKVASGPHLFLAAQRDVLGPDILGVWDRTVARPHPSRARRPFRCGHLAPRDRRTHRPAGRTSGGGTSLRCVCVGHWPRCFARRRRLHHHWEAQRSTR